MPNDGLVSIDAIRQVRAELDCSTRKLGPVYLVKQALASYG